MTITRLDATVGAPVCVPAMSRLAGFNTVWISGGGKEVILLSVAPGGACFDPQSKATSQTLVLDEGGEGKVRVYFLATVNGPATTVLTATDNSPKAWKQMLSFAPLQVGPGRFLWYGAAVGAAAGGDQCNSIFVEIDQNPDPAPMTVVAAHAASMAQIRLEDSSADGEVVQLDSYNCAEICVVDAFPETVTARLSLPVSPDGEILFVNCSFVANTSLVTTLPPRRLQDPVGGARS